MPSDRLIPEHATPTDWLPDLRARLKGRQLDLDEVLRLVVDAVTAQLDADRGTLYLVDHARNALVSRVAHLPEITEIRLAIGEGAAGWVARTGTVLRIARGAEDPRLARRIDALTGYHTETILAAPVQDARGHVVAVVQLLNKRGGEFDRDDERRLVSLTSDIAELLATSSLGNQLHPGQRHPLAYKFNDIVGESGAMVDVYDRTARAARTDATVLVRGESGTGKELIARAIHDNSRRRDAPFVKVDCAALPESLIENELFGHERGSYTGADRAATGKVHAAEGGTLFLDEVGELSLAVQGKLLRLLQDRLYLRVGGTRTESADVRFVCATHRNLEASVAEGAFRQDLYYRLRVVEVVMPPLRERGHADLDRLVDHFLFRYTARYDRPEVTLSSEARGALHVHTWPGNVRELEHCIESAVVLTPEDAILPEHLPILPELPGYGPKAVAAAADGAFISPIRSLHDVELAYILHVLRATGGNRSEAARVLGIGRNTLIRKLKG